MNHTPNSIRLGFAIACGFSLQASGWAGDLFLSTPKPTKAGNLAFEARGTANSQAVLELSANLVDWVPVEILTLTNGVLPLYLRPTGDLHFCRLRIPNANELPSPISFHPVLNTDFIQSTFSLDEPFSLKLTDDGGYTYALSVPESALADPDTCQLQVVNQASGLPPGLTYMTGAMISPSDLPVLGDVVLTLTPPTGTDLTKVAAIQWSRDGAELHFVPMSIADANVQIRIHRFGGVGLVRLNGGDLHSILQTVPAHPIARIEHQIALSAEPFKSLALAANRDRATTHVPTDCTQSTLALNLLRGSRAELRMAIYNDFFLETALNWYNALSGFGDASNEPCFAEVQALIDECDGLAAEALLASVEREVRRCRSERNLQAVLRLYRDIRLAHTGRWSRRFTQAQIEHLREVFHECLHFKVELLSTTSVQAKSGTVRTSMSSVFEVQNEPYVDPVSGNTVLRIHGNGNSSIDSTEWENPPTQCSAASAPVGGETYVFSLSLRGLATDTANLIIHSDEELPLPTYELYFDPFLQPPSEVYTLSCPPAPSIRFSSSFWATAFGGLHRDEIKKVVGKRSMLVIKNFVANDPREPHHADYVRSGKADQLDVTENTTIRITYLGGGQ